MIRTFVAIDLPTDIKQSLASPIERLKSRNPAVRWVRPDAMHITLKFLGDIPEDAVGPVSADLDEISAVTSPLRLGLSGFGAFPGVHRPRVVWVGVTGDTVRLADLAR
ncbi:MAG TPA: RNA 2',3'-cyclic phosphodiesterase, partial [Deltaproteobacteria bacterium]|nr:RNA 2',3'-cyclic phosphodiesterase [Deltaproteobacteria bacterium]